MIDTRRMAVLAVAVMSVVVLDGCRKKPTPQTAPATTVDTAAERRAREEQARRDAEDARRRADADARRRADSLAAARAAAAAEAAEAATMRSTLTAAVAFDYDQADLRPDATAALDAKLPILMANPGVMLRIAGNTDARGSDEYNLALGQRRAATAKRYLVDRGVAESRLETISYGEERPVAQGANEAAYAQNRRDEFEITMGGETLKKP
jgi:peptidoglycan-associated lipoprotein